MGVFRWTNLSALQHAPDSLMRGIGEQVARDARSYAPVDTGRLRNSIKVDAQAGNITVYSDVDYAVYQEFGTRHIAPRAFMGKALARVRAFYGA